MFLALGKRHIEREVLKNRTVVRGAVTQNLAILFFCLATRELQVFYVLLVEYLFVVLVRFDIFRRIYNGKADKRGWIVVGLALWGCGFLFAVFHQNRHESVLRPIAGLLLSAAGVVFLRLHVLFKYEYFETQFLNLNKDAVDFFYNYQLHHAILQVVVSFVFMLGALDPLAFLFQLKALNVFIWIIFGAALAAVELADFHLSFAANAFDIDSDFVYKALSVVAGYAIAVLVDSHQKVPLKSFLGFLLMTAGAFVLFRVQKIDLRESLHLNLPSSDSDIRKSSHRNFFNSFVIN